MRHLHRFMSLFASAVLLMACQPKQRQNPLDIQDTILVKTVSLAQAGSNSFIDATGVFSTDDETLLGFKNGGVIASIKVKEGDAVRKGQLLASVHSSEVDARAGQVDLAVEKAKRDYDRAKKLYQDSVATLEQVQNAKTAFEVAQQDIKTVSFNQQYSHIYAPESGFVLAKLANEGQVVGPGTPVLQVNGAAKGIWYLKVGVSDEQWSRIRKGDPAHINTDAYPQDTIPARVAKKSEGIDPQSGTFTIYLEILPQSRYKLASGIFGRAKIQTSTISSGQSWSIPYAALMNADGNQGYVFISEDGKVAKRLAVQIDRILEDQVLISKGLEGVQELITSGSPYLKDGSSIRIIK